MRKEMGALDEIERDPQCAWCFHGSGGHFAGGDVKSMQKSTRRPRAGRVESLNRFVPRLFNFSKPTIAMVDGFRGRRRVQHRARLRHDVASDRAKFGEVFLRIGLVLTAAAPGSSSAWSGWATHEQRRPIIDAAEALRSDSTPRGAGRELERDPRAGSEDRGGSTLAATLAKSFFQSCGDG